MRNDISGPRHSMSLKRAYGSSCNGFFAKLAVNELGFGPILEFAKKFGWNGSAVATDFLLSPSPIDAPDPMAASAHTVGRFAAGFGNVGLSAVHAAWQALAIANQGKPKSIRIFKDSENLDQPAIISPKAAKKLLEISEASVRGGTASSSFRDRRYRKLRSKVGGKTGTLTGYNPKGVTTWFVGSYPLENPEVIVVAVTVLEDLWQFRASTLAAEALLQYQDWKNIQTSLVNSESASLKKN